MPNLYSRHCSTIRRLEAVFFCAQNIAEFWNVATRPAANNGLGLSHEEVVQEVATIVMKVYGVESILTFNGADFKRYPGVVILDPAEI